MGPIGSPETSVTNYQSTMCNIPEERRFQIPSPFRNTNILMRSLEILALYSENNMEQMDARRGQNS
jgi:hypothetical protein